MRKTASLVLVFLLSPSLGAGCGDSEPATSGPGTGGSGAFPTVGGAGGGGAGGPVEPTTFEVRIENVSGTSSLPSPISPGVWAVHGDASLLFEQGQPDLGAGLEALAEDGATKDLESGLIQGDLASSVGVFRTPEGATQIGPALPGQAYAFQVTATPETGKLSFATMFVHSNDLFFGGPAEGIGLFDGAGAPISGEVTVSLWDLGTERNQPPGGGPDQASTQASAGDGAVEGRIARFIDGTRTLPTARQIVGVSVVAQGPSFEITLTNISLDEGAIVTPIAPVFYATHDAEWSLFEEGMAASLGLESLAEDGSPDALIAEHEEDPLIGEIGAVLTIDGGEEPGPAEPGASYTFTVTPEAEFPRLTLASMVVETNDAFMAPRGSVALLDGMGEPRSAEEVKADLETLLAVWDAGTEANEVPGVGNNQAPRQNNPNTGPDDPNPAVRLYADTTNDLAGLLLGGFVDVDVVGLGELDFEITITNTSGNTPYPGLLTPVLYALSDADTSMFEAGATASPGLESLAEDGDPNDLLLELDALPGVGLAAVEGVDPIAPGQSFTIVVTADPDDRFLHFASMVAPSNDTFMALEEGVPLLDANGDPRGNVAIENDIKDLLLAWQAGTEANQAGAAGPDQPPLQRGPNTGPAEGNGFVRTYDDPVWWLPATDALVRVTITPVE